MKIMTDSRVVGLTLALGWCLAAGCGDDPLSCGPGTQERDGACVPAAGTGSSGGTADSADDGAGADHGGDGADDGEEGGVTAGNGSEPYASCFGGSDAECDLGEQCLAQFDTCADACSRDTDCPGPPDGTAVQRCEEIDDSFSRRCVLFCGEAGFDCPNGMVCRESTLCPGGPTGGTDSVGGGCEFPMLEICIWE